MNKIPNGIQKPNKYKKAKGHKFTVKSSVRTLSIKCYAEQLEYGWDKTCELIREQNPNEIFIIAIMHNRDHNRDNIWEPSDEKEHYHIIIKMLNKRQKAIGSLLKLIGVKYREKVDDSLWENHGVETVGDFSAMATYLTHETPQAILDGKELYDLEELVSNLTIEEIKHIRQGYQRISESALSCSLSTLIALDDQAFALGYELGNLNAWFDSQPFLIRSHSKIRTIRQSYDRGVLKRLEERTELTRLCVYIKGEPNTGKTYAAESALQSKIALKVGGEGTGKFDNLTASTDAIIIDDDTCPNLLNVSDNYITRVYRRGSNNPVWAGKYLIVTSNLDFDDWLKLCGKFSAKQINAIRSRFYICHLVSIDNVNMLYCDQPSIRGNDTQQLERKRMYIDFKFAYDKSLAEYSPNYASIRYDDINGDLDEKIAKKTKAMMDYFKSCGSPKDDPKLASKIINNDSEETDELDFSVDIEDLVFS